MKKELIEKELGKDRRWINKYKIIWEKWVQTIGI
jgi:hypothetical protein